MLKRFANGSRVVRASELFQFAIVESLRAIAGAIDSQPVKLAQRSLFREDAWAAIARIQFDRYFGINDSKAIMNCFQNSFDLRRRHQRRGPAAKVNRVDLSRIIDLNPSCKLCAHAKNIAVRDFALIHSRRKVAIRTTRSTKGNMNVSAGVTHNPKITQITRIHSS